jgi:hypothetical protein
MPGRTISTKAPPHPLPWQLPKRQGQGKVATQPPRQEKSTTPTDLAPNVATKPGRAPSCHHLDHLPRHTTCGKKAIIGPGL